MCCRESCVLRVMGFLFWVLYCCGRVRVGVNGLLVGCDLEVVEFFGNIGGFGCRFGWIVFMREDVSGWWNVGEFECV